MSEPPPPPYYAGDAEKHGPPGQAAPYPAQGAQYPATSGGYPQYPQQPAYPPTSVAGPQGGYAPVATNQPQVATTVVVMTNQQFRDVPVNTLCQFCNQQVITQVTFNSGLLTYLACVGICLIGCDLGCCLIPFCLDGCKDVVHSCPNCNRRLGRYARI